MTASNLPTAISNFEAQTKDAVRIQKEVLKKILQQNGEAEYLKSLGLGGRTDPQSFKSCVPVVTHQDLQPLIQRIADGDPSPILTGKPITDLSLSSGTTQGKSKYVPFNEELFKSTMHVKLTSFAYWNREFPVTKGQNLSFIFGSKVTPTRGGIAATTATMQILKGEFSTANAGDDEQRLTEYCSPKEVIFGPNYQESLYCHLLSGLLSATQVQLLSSTFIHTIIQALRTLEQTWEDLCFDIAQGCLSPNITTPSIREAMNKKLLEPNPVLANQVRDKCLRLSQEGWEGAIPELWPNAKYVCGIMTGAMEPYVTKLRHYAGGLPLVSSNYGASEGWVGLNVRPRVRPEEVTFVVIPDAAYFEFLPLKGEGTGVTLEKPVGIEQLKVGEEYEVLFTSFAGLYRYKLGDVVRVVGFYNSSPEIRFICRRNLLLTLNIDKTTENDLQLAVEKAAKLLATEKLELIDFTSNVERGSDPGHYVIFWELSRAVGRDVDVLRACCDVLDKSFTDAGYVSARKVNAIGPLELRVVRMGTFRDIMEHSTKMGGSITQFKVPRCVPSTNRRLVEILSDNVIGRYFSMSY